MEKYFFDKTDVVRSVSAQLKSLPRGSRLTTTIDREKSGDFFVQTVITELSEDTDGNIENFSVG